MTAPDELVPFSPVYMFLTPSILVFMELNQSVNKDMPKDFRAGMRKVQAVASNVFTMSEIHIVHISRYFSAGGGYNVMVRWVGGG